MKKLIVMSHALILTVAFALTGSIAAKSQCQGLSESECSSNDSCTWVSGYEQKDGDKVKAYCRAKPGQGDGEKKGKKKKKDKSDDAVMDDEKAEKKEKKSKKKKEKKEDDGDKAEKKEKKSKKKDKEEKSDEPKKKKKKKKGSKDE